MRLRARAFVRVRLGRPKVVLGNMVKHLCVGLAALSCLAIAMAADAADLSMVPIYQSRPSLTAALNGSPKDNSRPINVPDPGRFKLSPKSWCDRRPARSRVPGAARGHVFWTGVYDRF